MEGAGFSPALPRLADNPTTVGSGFLSKWVALDVCRAVLGQQKEPIPISQTTQQKDTTMTGFGIGKSSEHRIAKQMARMRATADLMQKMKVQTLKGGIEIKSEKTFQTSNGYEVEMTVAVSQ